MKIVLHRSPIVKYPSFQDLKEECEARDLPEELLDEDEEMDLDEEEEARAMDLLTRYNKIINTLTTVQLSCSCRSMR